MGEWNVWENGDAQVEIEKVHRAIASRHPPFSGTVFANLSLEDAMNPNYPLLLQVLDTVPEAERPSRKALFLHYLASRIAHASGAVDVELDGCCWDDF